jgi:hypothetical protein
LIYFQVEDLDRNNPYSTMYSIDIDGDNKDLLLEAVSGLLSFIFPP